MLRNTFASNIEDQITVHGLFAEWLIEITFKISRCRDDTGGCRWQGRLKWYRRGALINNCMGVWNHV